ncbi:hypothetical protein JTB14_024467 [Gonioctena quinquepunctata]|nr:hypothetical protein JTB14_024467 [Gonioctena quinquepunctata]
MPRIEETSMRVVLNYFDLKVRKRYFNKVLKTLHYPSYLRISSMEERGGSGIVDGSSLMVIGNESESDLMVGAKQTQASGKKGRSSATYLAFQESVKEKGQKMKEQRTLRYQELQMTHRHICDMVGIYLGIEPNEVMEGVIDDPYHLELMENLIEKGRTRCILFYYQDGPPYALETGRSTIMGTRNQIKRIYVTNGVSQGINGKAVAVYTSNDVALDMKNVNEEVCFVLFDMDEGKLNFAAVAYDLLMDIMTPLLALSKDWGDLPKTANGRMQKLDFEGDFSAFVTFLDRTKEDLSGVITFSYDESVLEQIQGEQREKAFFDKVVIQQVESIVRVWHKLIERCLVQFRQLRRENEFVGPVAEIEYWRRQLARFTSLVEFLETDECKIFIDFLGYIDNKEIMKIWKKHLNDVYDTKNECSDNVKYLYSMERYWQPFYRLELPELAQHIPPLLHAIRMVFTTSRYYNSTGNVTALLVKVSNQIILKCRRYLDCEGTKTVWNQPKQVVLDKVKTCLDLYLKYYQCFKRTRREMEEAAEKPFECSEMFIFGKFETFKKRVEEIVNVLNTTIKYSILQKSMIEGIDVFAQKFVSFYKKISTQKYDALNHRLPYFDNDYKEFRQNVVDTEWELEEFVGSSLSKIPDVDNVLRLLKRFEKLNLECLHLDERYLEAMLMFQGEIEELRDRYNEERQTPSLPRNMPPVAGRIMWIRHFYSRIEEPMNVFRTKDKVIRHAKVQKCIQLFNALSMVFVHYENIYHEAWFAYAGQVRNCLMTPILTKHEKTRRYYVNFDPYIAEVIREAEYMYKLDLGNET